MVRPLPQRLSRPWSRRGWSPVLALLGALSLLLLAGAPALAAMDYAKQSLIGANFAGADLRGVTFNLTNLREANFQGADLRDATLDSAVFEGTNLTNAVLVDAFAFNTKFRDVSIEGADFSNVPLRADALKALCAIASGTNPVTGVATRTSLGCS